MSNDTLLNKNLLKQCAHDPGYGFEWLSNSCYMDSVLWVLFSASFPFPDNKILFSKLRTDTLHKIASCGNDLNDLNEKIFLEFQMEFRKIAYYFRCGIGTKNCSSFRRLYKKWHQMPQCTNFHSKTRFHSTEQQEAQEFLQFILSLYGMNGQKSYGAVSKQEFYYGVSKTPRTDTMWKFIYDRNDKTQSLVWNVSYHSLKNKTSQQRTLKKFLQHQDELWNITKQHKGCQFNSMKTIHSLIEFGDLLVFSLERTHPIHQTVSHFKIQLQQTLTDTKGKTLTLYGVVCHHGEDTDSGHYTAFRYSLKDKQWYYYDDINPPIQKIGGWQDLMSIRHIHTHCVLLFYTKIA